MHNLFLGSLLALHEESASAATSASVLDGTRAILLQGGVSSSIRGSVTFANSSASPGSYSGGGRVTRLNDEIIAERKLYLDGQPGAEPAAIVRLFRPHQVEGDYPTCRYEVISDTGVQGNEVSGVDGLDCIVTCLAVVGTNIAGLNESVYPKNGSRPCALNVEVVIMVQHAQRRRGR
jgi:hypothetical protein